MGQQQTHETIEGRAAYYRAEAERVGRLAAEAGPDVGGDRFQQVAREYRLLADHLDPEPET